MNMVFMSTGGISHLPATEAVLPLLEAGLTHFELSGGTYSPTMHENLLELKERATFQVHNYFPPPVQPFVFNLASSNPDISQISINHVKAAVRLAVELNRPIYSFHAGFLLDPQPKELGKRIPARPLFDRKEALSLFLERVNSLADYARKYGVKLLIENNVVSANNYAEFGDNPLLMTSADEAATIMENTPSNVGLLIDVAHLKVSANTLDFDPVTMLETVDRWIEAYHLSDNDGLSDSNEAVRDDSWFWPYIKSGLNYYSLEIYRVSTEVLVEQHKLVTRKLGE